MFRVFDTKENVWVKNNVYLSIDNDLVLSKDTWFGAKKLTLIPDSRYVYHRDIGTYDVYNKLIYEGDFCRIIGEEIAGLVAYVPEEATYCLLDGVNMKFYPLGTEYCEKMVVIGNVFSNPDLLKQFYKVEEHENETT